MFFFFGFGFGWGYPDLPMVFAQAIHGMEMMRQQRRMAEEQRRLDGIKGDVAARRLVDKWIKEAQRTKGEPHGNERTESELV